MLLTVLTSLRVLIYSSLLSVVSETSNDTVDMLVLALYTQESSTVVTLPPGGVCEVFHRDQTDICQIY